MRRRVSIFGATGSIGQSTLDLIGREPDRYEVVALTGASNIVRLAEDAIRLRAEVAVTADEDRLQDLRDALSGTGIEAAAGQGALIEAADRPTDWVMSGIVGFAGLAPGLRALRHGGTLALANKESLVCAGPILLAEARRHGATVLPVDSEHSALFQALVGERMDTVEKVIITGSGGGLRDWPLDRLASATPEEAGTHPNWDMGQRITIDSATMFNKAMELIEAHELFDLPSDRIETVIHPQSLIHALVQYSDGALMAHMGTTDMRHAIGYALNWPDRRHLPVERLDLPRIGRLDFRAPDPARYPAIDLAWRVIETGGLSGTAFNAAKEMALDLFIGRSIRFTDMAPLVARTMDALESRLEADAITLDMVRDMDARARETARRLGEQAMATR
ncbi:1-deoxy-D-xylulose-5-phosphate reductoisomerase [Jannaschia aquimarina]|uniref:1-deoxy-D-xylulose 5-phosphate reductoisomerase n=1 Tax=Jannaschia aquimarina TaxID=935700 RepID=A0A0D1CMH9_9RHOB|nr:1-deoxy-D-xylulose-5-phosphate reductoisomerase [Jannaschia aquimarina]KIT15997.1 1-deoxy-D-xylulose 5-phosphate reductoisomerase [Jannaschia aquimarina]SNS99661.1 1-deoxy-D-xylulose 5-phosphate reductoisomerase [Jannaschia aquimarina]